MDNWVIDGLMEHAWVEIDKWKNGWIDHRWIDGTWMGGDE